MATLAERKEVYIWHRAWEAAPKRAIVILLIATFVLPSGLLLLASCSSGQSEPSTSEATGATTAPPREFPSFVYNSAQALQAYEIAVKIPEALPLMPCYCRLWRSERAQEPKGLLFQGRWFAERSRGLL
jgi:hypothetical protein